jgi:hypothetical protein
MKDSHSSTSPLPEHSGGSPENVPSGGRPGDRAEGDELERRADATAAQEASQPWATRSYLEGLRDRADEPLRGALTRLLDAPPLSAEDAVELERLAALSSEELDVELAVLGVDPAPFLERVRTFVATLPEVRPLPPLEFTIELEHDEPAALSKPGDRPTTTRDAEVMAEAAARAWRPPAV